MCELPFLLWIQPRCLEMCATFPMRRTQYRVCCYSTAPNDSALCEFYTTAPLTTQSCWENVLRQPPWQLWKIHCFTSQNRLFESMKLKVWILSPSPCLVRCKCVFDFINPIKLVLKSAGMTNVLPSWQKPNLVLLVLRWGRCGYFWLVQILVKIPTGTPSLVSFWEYRCRRKK